MTILQAIILGLVQGLAEFLPISSSAHLLLVRWFAQWPDPGLAFDVALHWGTLFGVIIYFRREILNMIFGGFGFLKGEREFNNVLPLYVVLGTIPAGVAGLFLEETVETTLRSPWVVVVTLTVIAILMYIADQKTLNRKNLNTLDWKTALLIGSAQGLAVIPGVSRSGISISIALFLGFSRTSAVQFSFLLSIPLILGAGLTKIGTIVTELANPTFVIGLVTAAISGFAAISFLMAFVKNRTFTPFVIYRLALAGVLVLWLTLRVTP